MDETLPFGKRLGFEPLEESVQLNEINSDLRTELWNSYYIFFYDNWEDPKSYDRESFMILNKLCWIHFFKLHFDNFPEYHIYEYKKIVKAHFIKGNWIKIYEFFEFIIINADKRVFKLKPFENYINIKLRNNNSAYTLIGNRFVPITNETELNEIKKLNKESKGELSSINLHLQSAINFLSDKNNPDFRNSIKESISMVEVISRIIEPSENTLGKALNKIEEKKRINSVLKSGLEKLYAYTNGKNGIRHAIMDEEKIDIEDARFFLVSCSAFTNYLIEKAKKESLIK